MIFTNRINEIIKNYIGYEELYEVLKQFYVENEITREDETIIINRIKKIIVSYYLNLYKFKTYSSNEIQDLLLSNLSKLCDLSKKVKDKNGKIKIYPVIDSDENKERVYKEVIKEMVNYQIQNYISTEKLFELFVNKIGSQLQEYKQSLIKSDMELYYGSIYYIIERSLFIINCIRNITNESLNLEEIEDVMLQYKNKYIDTRDNYGIDADYIDVSDEFYNDYDLIESYYKKLLIMEKELAPIVAEQWKKYLTNPLDNKEDYRYVMHCFSSGMVDPNLMRGACCSLYTQSIENLMYGNSGLIYDIDAYSVDTMCTGDAGSWFTNKEEFIERGCPSRWQLTCLDGNAVYYENPLNCKLIMPNVFENDCIEKINNNDFHYSEIFLNEKARPIGVFYTSDCENIEEVELYAQRYNLPLIKIDIKESKFK